MEEIFNNRENPLQTLPWEIADVSFGKGNEGSLKVYQDMTNMRKEFIKNNQILKLIKNDEK